MPSVGPASVSLDHKINWHSIGRSNNVSVEGDQKTRALRRIGKHKC